ncbi:TetR/AcrR family transcriptional regulator [Roseibium aggregatum]|uniref:TetR/AcrR family transcriptional regulator n=1 Tax=Roseibium aggregatum TaxID=187304 RepID=A0A926NW96_9HYPH|nr:TetR/AcrR family transcriptional regulator [Roseibium aggregatum]MBD1544968.1 TetR/AcrR family transcriptional regulator [Roseibium aggregatum]
MARTRASDFEDKQRSILESAAAVFAEQGMEKASMSLVANSAGVSKSLLYHYYPAKDALIFAIIQSHLEDLDAAVEAADDPKASPEDRLHALVRITLENYRDADNEHKVQLNASVALNDDQRDEIRAIERRIVRRFSLILREINPSLDNAERPLLMPVTMSLFGMMNWAYMWFREGGPITRDDYADIATTLVLEGIKAVR